MSKRDDALIDQNIMEELRRCLRLPNYFARGCLTEYFRLNNPTQ
jgi:hypothetical protein